MQKSGKYWILYLVIAVAAMLLFSVRTSPVYSFLLGDYGGNEASTGMLIGKYWLQGTVPYKDLFAMGSPLYFLIQAVGWGISERTGIFVLQILNYFIFLIFMTKALRNFCSEKASNIFGLLSIVLYMALCCGGDSATEWCLSFTAVLLFLAFRKTGSVKKTNLKFLAMGILCSSVFMIEPISGGMVYGLSVFTLVAVCRKERRKNDRHSVGTGYVISFLVGFVILCIPFVTYFSVYGCLNDMFRAMLLYPIHEMVLESEMAVIIHKLVKCVLVVPLFAAGIVFCISVKRDHCGISVKRDHCGISVKRDHCGISVKRDYCGISVEEDQRAVDVMFRKQRLSSGILMIVCAVCQGVFLLLCRNDWYFYLMNIPGIMIALAFFVSVNRKKVMVFLTAGTIVVTAGIGFSPLKNYCYYLADGVPEVAEEFLTDLQSFQTRNEQCRMLFLDTDSTWYLLIDQKSQYRYFSDQTNLASLNGEIAKEKERYLSLDNDVIISTEHGWTGQDFEKYSLTQVYLKKRGNICIYVPNEG